MTVNRCLTRYGMLFRHMYSLVFEHVWARAEVHYICANAFLLNN